MNEAKETIHNGAPGPLEILGDLPPIAVTMLTEMFSRTNVPVPIPANLTVSNIRGSSEPMYVAGASLEAMYPLSLLGPGLALNITCVSYVDNIDVGFIFCPDSVPETWSLADSVETALESYVSLLPGEGGVGEKALGNKQVKRSVRRRATADNPNLKAETESKKGVSTKRQSTVTELKTPASDDSQGSR